MTKPRNIRVGLMALGILVGAATSTYQAYAQCNKQSDCAGSPCDDTGWQCRPDRGALSQVTQPTGFTNFGGFRCGTVFYYDFATGDCSEESLERCGALQSNYDCPRNGE